MRYARVWMPLGLLVGLLLLGVGAIPDVQAQSRERTTGPATRSQRGPEKGRAEKGRRYRERDRKHHKQRHRGGKRRGGKYRGRSYRGRDRGAKYRGPKHHRRNHRGRKHRGRKWQPPHKQFGPPKKQYYRPKRHYRRHGFHKQATFGWYRDRRRHRAVNVDVYVEYRPVIRRRTARYLVIDLHVELIRLGGGRHRYGRIHHLPSGLRRMQITVYRDGPVVYDRGLHLMQGAGGRFGLVATVHHGDGRYYGPYDGRPTAFGAINWERGSVHRYRGEGRYGEYGSRGINLAPDRRDLLDEILAGGGW